MTKKSPFSISLQSSKFTIFIMLFKKFGVETAKRVFNYVVGAGSLVGGSLYLETFLLIQAERSDLRFPFIETNRIFSLLALKRNLRSWVFEETYLIRFETEAFKD